MKPLRASSDAAELELSAATPVQDLPRRSYVSGIAWTSLFLVFAALAFTTRQQRQTGEIFRHRYSIGAAQPGEGHSFTVPFADARLSSHEHPSVARLVENGVPLANPNALHDEIRTLGRGRYSFWNSTLYFSASDNSDPRANGRLYLIDAPYFLPSAVPIGFTVLALCSLFPTAAFFLYWGRDTTRLYRSAVRELEGAEGLLPLPHSRKFIAVPRSAVLLLISILSAALIAGGLLELALALPEYKARLLPSPVKDYPSAPTAWKDGIGLARPPGTDFLFWSWAGSERTTAVPQRTNSLGFVDKEPASVPAAPKVMILGDAFVEALETPVESKLGPQLEQLLKAQAGAAPEVRTFGVENTGQAGQYPVWREHRDVFRPDALVLVMALDDLRENEPSLSARFQQSDPLHPPHFSFGLARGELTEIPPEKTWASFAALTKVPPAVPDAGWLAAAKSVNFLKSKLSASTPEAANWYQLFDGLYIDYAVSSSKFWDEPAIRSAYEVTERIVARYQAEAEQRGTRLLLLQADTLRPEAFLGNGSDYSMFHVWLSELAKKRDLPLVSLPALIQERELHEERLRSPNGKWNAQAARLLAEQLAEKLVVPGKRNP